MHTAIRQTLTLAIATLAIAGTSLTAMAADLGARPITKGPVVAPAPTYNWTGCYIGGHGGGLFDNISRTWTVTDHFQVAGSAFDTDYSAGAAGGQVGCQWQYNQFVFGIEGTGTWVGNDDRIFLSPFASTVGSDPVRVSNDIDSLFTVVGRLGFLVTPQVHLYAKGGYANVRIGSFIDDVVGHVSNDRVNHGGWTVGAGAEWMFAQGWVLGIDYSFITADTRTHANNFIAGGPAPPTFYQTDIDADLHLITGRVSYLFNWFGR